MKLPFNYSFWLACLRSQQKLAILKYFSNKIMNEESERCLFLKIKAENYNILDVCFYILYFPHPLSFNKTVTYIKIKTIYEFVS